MVTGVPPDRWPRSGQFDRKKKLFRIKYKLCNAESARHWIRTRARRRPRRRISAFDFEDEHEHDDEDDDNTLHVARHNPLLNFSFFVVKSSFIREIR